MKNTEKFQEMKSELVKRLGIVRVEQTRVTQAESREKIFIIQPDGSQNQRLL